MAQTAIERRHSNSALMGLDTETTQSSEGIRSFERKACIEDGTIVLDNGERLACVIRNASENGALIMLKAYQILPRTVFLEFPGVDMRMEAEVRWQMKQRAGLKLVRWHCDALATADMAEGE